MSESLINAGRQTLLLELQEASRLPERLGEARRGFRASRRNGAEVRR